MDRIRGMKYASFLAIGLIFGSVGELDAAPAKTAKTVKTATVPSATPPVRSEPVKVFDNATFLLPKEARVSPRWMIPPTDAEGSGGVFSIDQAGTPVIGRHTSSDFTILYPSKEYGVSLSPSVSNFLHLDNGVMLLVSGNSVGFMVKPDAKSFNDKKIPRGGFQPIVSFPLKSIEAIGKSGNTFYCAGMNPRTKRYSLYALRSLSGGGLTDMELRYESEEPISAIGADAESVYVAKGRQVVRIMGHEGTVSALYTHPSDSVIDIAPFKDGIVVGTATEAVYVGASGTMEILRSSGHRIAARQNGLYLFFTQSRGVLSLDNISELGRFNLSVRPASSGKTVPPVSVAGVNFFESGGAPYTQKQFSQTFDKGNIRRIVAQIDLKLQPSKKETKHTLTVSWYEPTGGRMLNRSYPIVVKPGAATQQFFAVIGEEADIKGYIPRSKGNGGLTWRLGKDALGSRYPGRYRLNVQVDGTETGEWYFTIAGKTTFIDALFYDDLPMIKTVLDQTPMSEYVDADGNSFLNLAVEYGSVEAVKLVLAKGVNPNAADKKGKKPLELLGLAAPEPKKKAELLIQHGANVNDVSGADQDPIVLSTYNPEIVALMIRNGADIHKKDKRWERSIVDKIMFDYSFGCQDELISVLVNHGVDLNKKNPKYPYLSYLGSAIERGDDACVENLLKRGVAYSTVQSKTSHGPERSALYVALNRLYERSSGKYDLKLSAEEIAKSRKIVRLLLDQGARLIPGKKHMTTQYFDVYDAYLQAALSDKSMELYQRYTEQEALTRNGEGRMMFLGESPLFFSREAMQEMIRIDDAALDEAGRFKDDDIRQMALYTHLDRVRELLGAANSSSYLYRARDHCEAAFKIAEARYKAMQVSYAPDQVSAAGKDLILLPRGEGGAYVQKTVPQSAAELAGLLPGDIILAIDTQKIKNSDEAKTALSALAPGMPVQITFLRAEPVSVPELPLTCGLLDYARKEKGFAQMNLAQWLNSKPQREEVEKISTVLNEVMK